MNWSILKGNLLQNLWIFKSGLDFLLRLWSKNLYLSPQPNLYFLLIPAFVASARFEDSGWLSIWRNGQQRLQWLWQSLRLEIMWKRQTDESVNGPAYASFLAFPERLLPASRPKLSGCGFRKHLNRPVPKDALECSLPATRVTAAKFSPKTVVTASVQRVRERPRWRFPSGLPCTYSLFIVSCRHRPKKRLGSLKTTIPRLAIPRQFPDPTCTTSRASRVSIQSCQVMWPKNFTIRP